MKNKILLTITLLSAGFTAQASFFRRSLQTAKRFLAKTIAYNRRYDKLTQLSPTLKNLFLSEHKNLLQKNAQPLIKLEETHIRSLLRLYLNPNYQTLLNGHFASKKRTHKLIKNENGEQKYISVEEYPSDAIQLTENNWTEDPSRYIIPGINTCLENCGYSQYAQLMDTITNAEKEKTWSPSKIRWNNNHFAQIMQAFHLSNCIAECKGVMQRAKDLDQTREYKAEYLNSEEYKRDIKKGWGDCSIEINDTFSPEEWKEFVPQWVKNRCEV